MENTERQADDSAVNFDSHDIRATQSKKSPTYFVNVDKPREKLPKAKKRKIIIICVSALVAATLVGGTIFYFSQPANNDEPSGEQQTDEPEVPAEIKDNQTIAEITENPAYSTEQANALIDKKIANTTNPQTAFQYNIIRIMWLNTSNNCELALTYLAQIDESKLSNEQLFSYYNAMLYAHGQLGHKEEYDFYNAKSEEIRKDLHMGIE